MINKMFIFSKDKFLYFKQKKDMIEYKIVSIRCQKVSGHKFPFSRKFIQKSFHGLADLVNTFDNQIRIE